jgi:hypothetical protein
MTDSTANSIERPQDLGQSPEAVARRWKLELKLADKRERDWRKKAADIYKLYTPDTPATNSFNIFWANTETLRQSVYNSLPQPDARRRYQDADPLGQAVGMVLTRSLEFSQDTYDFDGLLQDDALAMLLAGRAVSRVRYVPDIRTTPAEPAGSDAEVETYEEIAWEQAICERIQYDDFRILCAAKSWDAVTAIGFRHRMTRQDCIDKFDMEIGNAIKMDAVDDEDVKKASEADADLFKTAEVWEIWDKTAKQVIWISETYPRPCKTQVDPLGLTGFFPVPRPLYAIQNDRSLVPACLYTQYEQQTKELNRISMRINKLVDALRVRGIYDATLGELSQLMKSGDNELIPGQNVTALLERGGLEKAIWMMPIDVAAAVLKELYVQRDATKQIIYEITGVSDIMRSASDPAETYGAQKIKTQWGTQRLQRMQKEVQRYTRDLIRLKAEVISAKFQPETLEQMTLVDLPHQAEVDQQKQMAMLQYQQAAQQARQTGQQPPPPPPQQPDPITWEAVVQAMRSDATRTYRIDIETDSTLSATQDSDMQGLKEVLTGLSQIMQGFGPAVQQGAMSVEVLKELMLVVTRRARMGTAIEDVIAKIEQPPKPADPNAGQVQIEQQKMQMAAQLEQMKAQQADQQNQRQLQFDQQRAQMEAQVSMQAEAHKQQMQAAQIEQQNQLEAQRMHLQMQNEAALEQMRIAADERMKTMEQQMQVLLAHINNAAKIEVAEIAAGTTLEAAQISAAKQSEGE